MAPGRDVAHLEAPQGATAARSARLPSCPKGKTAPEPVPIQTQGRAPCLILALASSPGSVARARTKRKIKILLRALG